MSAPLVPVRRVLRLSATGAVAGRGLLAASAAWLVVLAAVYASDAGPPLQAMAVTAALLVPVAAWAAAAALAAGSTDLRAVLAAASGRGRLLAADGLLALAWTAAATVAGVLAPLLFDPHAAATSGYLLGALLHLLCGAAGAALGLLLDALRLSGGVQLAVVVLVSLLSGRLAAVPPIGPVLSAWGSGAAPGPDAAAWALTGPVLVTAVLLTATAGVRRRG